MSDTDQSVRNNIETLLSQTGSLALSTLQTDGSPDISYTPYIKRDERLYIFISQLASHTQNLKQDPRCSALIIEDEASAKNLFARRRLILRTRAEFLDRRDPSWPDVMREFEAQRGKTLSLLKSLPDFHLVALTISGGNYVQGFGQAFAFEGCDFDSARQLEGK